MKKHLNTLFVTTQGAYLAKEGETVVVKVNQGSPTARAGAYHRRHCLFRQCVLQSVSDGILR